LEALKILIGFLGILFLIKSGYEKLIQKGFSPIVDDRLPGNDFHNVILSALSFSLINPHAYLDGIVLIGGYSARFPHLSERVFFGFGAAFFSLLWFLFLSIGSSLLVVFFNGKRSIRPIVNFSGVLLFIFSGKLTLEVVGWINEVYPESLTSLVSLFKEYK
jgi:L-lysine exporter family protein LysE/ArgO